MAILNGQFQIGYGLNLNCRRGLTAQHNGLIFPAGGVLILAPRENDRESRF